MDIISPPNKGLFFMLPTVSSLQELVTYLPCRMMYVWPNYLSSSQLIWQRTSVGLKLSGVNLTQPETLLFVQHLRQMVTRYFSTKDTYTCSLFVHVDSKEGLLFSNKQQQQKAIHSFLNLRSENIFDIHWPFYI